MDIQNNYVTIPDGDFPDNRLWNPQADPNQLDELKPFLPTPAGKVGIGLATLEGHARPRSARQGDSRPPEHLHRNPVVRRLHHRLGETNTSPRHAAFRAGRNGQAHPLRDSCLGEPVPSPGDAEQPGECRPDKSPNDHLPGHCRPPCRWSAKATTGDTSKARRSLPRTGTRGRSTTARGCSGRRQSGTRPRQATRRGSPRTSATCGTSTSASTPAGSSPSTDPTRVTRLIVHDGLR